MAGHIVATEDQIEHEVAALSGALAMATARVSHDERARLVYRLLAHHARKDATAVMCACDTALEGLRGKLPEPLFRGGAPFFSGMRAEAEMWADSASDGQIVAMLAACLERVGGTRIEKKDRKRLFVTLWNGMEPEERRSFLDRVATPERAG